MKIAIIEDEIVAAEHLQQILKEDLPDIEIMKVLRSVKRAVEWLTRHVDQLDLLIMDIKLLDGLSFEIFDSVQISKPVIFTTAYDAYAIRAFKVNSVDYLLKPIAAEELSTALEKWRKIYQPQPIQIDYQALAQQIKVQESVYKDRFLVKGGALLHSIPIEDIAYFVAEGNLVLLTTVQNKSFPINYALDALEDLLNPKCFFRITRNTIVHIQSVGRVATFFKGRLQVSVNPALKEPLMVSSKKAAAFKQWLDN